MTTTHERRQRQEERRQRVAGVQQHPAYAAGRVGSPGGVSVVDRVIAVVSVSVMAPAWSRRAREHDPASPTPVVGPARQPRRRARSGVTRGEPVTPSPT